MADGLVVFVVVGVLAGAEEEAGEGDDAAEDVEGVDEDEDEDETEDADALGAELLVLGDQRCHGGGLYGYEGDG